MVGKDDLERRSAGVNRLFLTDEEGRAVGRAHGKALRQFSLASASGWQRYRQNSKESYNTIFFSKIIRNEQMEAALRKLLSYVTKDFIHPWYYKNISTNSSFPNYIDFVLHSAVAELYNRALNVDVTQLVLIKIVGLITTHIREVQNAEKLLRASRLPNSRNQEELNRQLAQHYNQGKLHPALNASSPDTTQHEYAWFRKRLKPFIPLLIPRKETSSGIVHVLLREILITCLLRPIVNNFSQPDYWNQLFDTFGGYLLDQQQQNRLLRKPSEYIPDIMDPSGSSKGDLPSFDVYLRQIDTCTNLPDAYRIRDNIIKEIDSKGASIAGCAPDDIINGIKVSKTTSYISRLKVALKRIDKVIANLSVKNKQVTKTDFDGQLTLSYVLEDSTLLPFFDDYLNMIGRASLLQFYVSVVNFQDQLYIEKPITSLDDVLDPNIVETWDLISVAVNLCDLWKDYMAPDATPGIKISSSISPSFLKHLSDYVETLNLAEDDVEVNSLGTEKTCMAVKCMLCALHDVVEVMRTEDFPSFLKHPIGQKLVNRFTGANNPLRFLRARSPERERPSMESDRSTEDHEEDLQPFGRKKSIFGFDMLKMPRRNSKSRQIAEEREEIPESSPVLTENFEIDGELQNIVNSEENSFIPTKKKNRLSPFFGDKETSLKYDVASQGRAFLESFRKKPATMPIKDKDLDGQSPTSSNSHLRAPSEKEARKPKSSEFSSHTRATSLSRATDKDLSKSSDNSGIGGEVMGKTDNDADDFIQLEMEDNHPSPIDDLINIPQCQSHPFMIILPAKFFNLDESLEKLKIDYAKAEQQIKETDRSNDPEKLKNLHYIERGIWHEMQEILEQKQKIEKTELDNVILPGRVSVAIQASHVVKQDGKDYAVYPIQVTRLNSEGTSSGWIILRRYSQFLTLHQDLKVKFPSIMQAYELPGKLISGIMKKRSAFMDSRRESLEKYIMQLLAHPEICKVQVFRRFICHPEIVRLLYGEGQVGESPTKKNFLRNVVYSVDDTMDTIFQRRNQRTTFSSEQTPVPASVFSHNPLTREFTAKKEEGEVVSSTAEPILDLFVELFELKGLRRQAVVILIQNLFGDTVERKVTEGLRDSLSQEKMISVVNTICDNFWPNGVWATSAIVRNDDQKIRTKFEASSKITQLFPEIFGGIVGRQTARKGAVRICTALQNPRLNQHLMYKILDEILTAIFQKV